MLFDVGIAFISSRLKTVERWVCVTSTTGEAPETRHGLLKGTDIQRDVEGGGEIGRQLDAFPDHAAEAIESECDRVQARSQIDDGVLALPVGDRGPPAFNQRRARCFNDGARKHGPGVVSNLTGNRALRAGDRRVEREYRCKDDKHLPRLD
jgi:hypothetical protein